MFQIYRSSQEAFAALHLRPTNLWHPNAVDRTHDEDPMCLEDFIQGAETFEPPLTMAEAKYAFKGLDLNSDGSLNLTEFREGIACGQFFCKNPPTLTTTTRTTSVTTTVTRSTTTEMITTTTTTRTTLFLHPVVPAVTEKPTASDGSKSDAGAPITLAEFKSRMLKVYASPEKAYAVLEAGPSGLDEFIRLTKTFKPPLSTNEAKFAFRALDADHNNALASFEFLGSLAFNRFFPSREEQEAMGVPNVSWGTHGTTTPLPETGFGQSALAIIVFATFSAVLLVLTFLTTHVYGWHKGGDRLKSYTSLGARVRLATESVAPRDAIPGAHYGLLHQPHPSCEVQLLGGPAATTGRVVSVPNAWRVPSGRRGTTVQL